MNLGGEAGDLVGATAQKLFDNLLEKHKTAPKSKNTEIDKAVNKAIEKTQEPSDKALGEAAKKPMTKGEPKIKKLKHTFGKHSKALDMVDKLKSGLGNNSDDLLDELAGYKVQDVEQKSGHGRTKEQVKNDFIKNMDASNYKTPEAFKAAQERIKKMSPEDFSFLLAEIMDDDDEAQG